MSGDERPWVLIDFDGVLNVAAVWKRLPRLQAAGWRAGTAYLDSGPELVCCCTRAGQWLTGLARETGARLAWATMREVVANERCAPLVGLPSLPVIPVLEAIWKGSASTKAESVVPWTNGAPFTWFEDLDDEVAEADHLAGDQPHRMIQVDSRWGLTEDHIQNAREWLLSLGATTREGQAS